MIKKSLISLFIIITLPAFCIAATESGTHAGIPKGFYEDIDPNSLDEEENVTQSSEQPNYKEENAYEHIYGDDVVLPPAAKATKDYAKIYNELEPADFSYQHNIDPDQYYDMKDTAWSVYPLLRLNSAIYFKGETIAPGYYLLTPREHKGKWYMLFKQNGSVAHIIPVYDRDYTPETFYDEHIPKPKLTPSQKIHTGFLSVVGKVKSSKRKDPIKSYLEVNDLENYFISIVIYYGSHKYSTIFRTIRL